MAPLAGQKRKVDYNAPGTPAQMRKRQKGKDARAISTQTADAALSKTGELNLASFVKAREYEIAALQQSMKKSRKSLTQRAFQQVPRHMRRRTASHNVKKIPRRLRPRAFREIKEDNTPTGSARNKRLSSKLRLRLDTAKRLGKLNARQKSVRQKRKETKRNGKEADPEKHIDIERAPRIKKNKLVTAPQATSKFKRRQINKTWLPTHLWHTKRAHMTRPTLPLWRMAIPLRPTEKTYRSTHRAAGSRGCVTWDTSYISTIGCQGTEQALQGMLKALGITQDRCTGTRHEQWKIGTRHYEGWMHERDNRKPIAPVTVLWQARSTSQEHLKSREQVGVDAVRNCNNVQPAHQRNVKLDRRILLRLHPSAFHQGWVEILKAAKMQKPQVLIEDLRFEIGSIAVQGPQSTEALIGVMKLAGNQSHIQGVWSMLSALSNPANLPLGTLIPVSILDPRLYHPPRQVAIRRDEQSMNKLNEMIVSWPLDRYTDPSTLFEHKTRYSISKLLPSQKAVNRRRADVLSGQQIEISDKDPEIPAILLAHRSSRSKSNMQGDWTVMLPWSCVDIVWRSLMYYPLSSGSTPRFGGLEQTRQVAFERCTPWFPADFPGTSAGKAWDRTESENRFDHWLRRPPSKRYSWHALDLGLNRKGELGRGWACDWEYLFRDTTSRNEHNRQAVLPASVNSVEKLTQPRLLTQRHRKAATRKKESEAPARRRNSSSPESEDELGEVHNDVHFDQLLPSEAAGLMMMNEQQITLPTTPALATVRIQLLTRGIPKSAARIYRLPLSYVPPPTGSAQGDNGQSVTATKHPIHPPAPNFLPVLLSDSPGNASTNLSLRDRWLAIDPNPLALQANPKSSTALSQHIGAQKTNRNGDPVGHAVYDPKHARDLSHIRVFPPRETKSEVLGIFGPRPPPKTKEEILKALQPQLVPRKVVNSDGDLIPEALWDKHVPCPGPEDLIGFVTSGGYNLTEGRGTAIGSVWAQRVVAGWEAENKRELNCADGEPIQQTQGSSSVTARAEVANKREKIPGNSTNEKAQEQKAQKQRQKQISRERHLCIVRNAGESIGRLAIWELC